MMTCYVMTVSSGSPLTLGSVAGSGTPRVFSGDAIYLYKLSGALWTTRDYGGLWVNIIPNGLTWVSTVCQTSGSSSTEVNMTNTTYVTGTKSGAVPVRYQNYPENTAWNSGASIPSGDLSDSVSSTSGDLPVLIGNIAPGNTARAWRTAFYPPYAATKSDAGLPITARITDLDIAE